MGPCLLETAELELGLTLPDCSTSRRAVVAQMCYM
jgi:hypothetical protein